MPEEDCCQDRKRQNHIERVASLIGLGGVRYVDGLSSTLDMGSRCKVVRRDIAYIK
jgi:hypothetical protein